MSFLNGEIKKAAFGAQSWIKTKMHSFGVVRKYKFSMFQLEAIRNRQTQVTLEEDEPGVESHGIHHQG